MFADSRLAALYDVLHPFDPRGDFGLYLPMIMDADAVLDVGCGTGLLLHTARERGHRGRLVGLDPAPGMLAQARQRPNVEWRQGDLTTEPFEEEFDLIVMTGHAFQVFLTDAEIRQALTAVRAALKPTGRFAFETRNPLVQAWRRWTPEHGRTVVADGVEIRVEHRVQRVDGEFVNFTHTFSSAVWDRPEVSRSTLRFIRNADLVAALTEAGLRVEEQFGDWDSSPLTEQSPEIITVARPD